MAANPFLLSLLLLCIEYCLNLGTVAVEPALPRSETVHGEQTAHMHTELGEEEEKGEKNFDHGVLSEL